MKNHKKISNPLQRLKRSPSILVLFTSRDSCHPSVCRTVNKKRPSHQYNHPFYIIDIRTNKKKTQNLCYQKSFKRELATLTHFAIHCGRN